MQKPKMHLYKTSTDLILGALTLILKNSHPDECGENVYIGLKTRWVPAARCSSAPLLQAAVKPPQRSNTRDLHARETRRSLSARIGSDCEGEDYCPRDCLVLTSFLSLFTLLFVWMSTWDVYVREWSD